MQAKLKQTIQLSKCEALGSQKMLDITYEVQYSDVTKIASLIPNSIQIKCHLTNRIIRDDDVLKSDFMLMFCRQDAKLVNWWEKMAEHKFRQERLQDIKLHDEKYEDPAYEEIMYEQRQASF